MRRVDLSNSLNRYMTNQSFIYWLQGWFELTNPTVINSKVLEQIKDHIKLVNINERSGFVWFLLGVLEDRTSLNKKVTESVKNALKNEFNKVTPDRELPRALDQLFKDIQESSKKRMIDLPERLDTKIIC